MKYLFTLAFLIGCTTLFGQSDKELVEATVDKNNIKGHIYFLADDLLKGRETGTQENKIAASYLANTLRSYGVQPNPETGTYYQRFDLQKVSPAKQFSLSVNGTSYKKKVALEGQRITYKGEAVFLGYGLEDDYNGKEVAKKLIIIKAGGPDTKDAQAAYALREQKAALAKKAGAIGIVELLKADANIWNFIDHNFNADRIEIASNEKQKSNGFTHIWVHDEYGSYAKELETTRSITADLMSSGEMKTRTSSQNVIGIVEGTDPKLKNEYIIYSAHYDHVGVGQPDATGDTIYNGARDNAVGVTTVLSMAENLAKYPTKRSALFILFTAEEKGLLGSKYYVENPVLPLKQMVYCFNSDNAGYNDTSLATIIGLPRTTAEQSIKNAATAFGLTAVDDPAPEQGLFDRSDNVHFAAKGIPAPTFSLGFTAFNGDVTKYYHRPGDHADSIDYDYMLQFFRAYVLAGRTIANDLETPTWTKGDKYETAGKKLYSN